MARRAVKPAFVPCRVAKLPEDRWEEAAKLAIAQNPANAPTEAVLAMLTVATVAPFGEDLPVPYALAAATGKYLKGGAVDLSVQFVDTTSTGLRDKIMEALNLWGKGEDAANVRFRWTSSSGQIRIARVPENGHYAYEGTDNFLVPLDQVTMNLALTERSPDSEFLRVPPHEAGHVLGFIHEHTREGMVPRILRQQAYRWYQRFQGWDRKTVDQQVLTPRLEATLTANEIEEISILCYGLPAEIMRDGKAVPGGSRITAADMALAVRLFPKAAVPPPPPDGRTITLSGDVTAGTWKLVRQ